MHYIEKDPKTNTSGVEAQHYLYKDSDIVDNYNKSCGYIDNEFEIRHPSDYKANTFLKVSDVRVSDLACKLLAI